MGTEHAEEEAPEEGGGLALCPRLIRAPDVALLGGRELLGKLDDINGHRALRSLSKECQGCRNCRARERPKPRSGGRRAEISRRYLSICPSSRQCSAVRLAWCPALRTDRSAPAPVVSMATR